MAVGANFLIWLGANNQIDRTNTIKLWLTIIGKVVQVRTLLVPRPKGMGNYFVCFPTVYLDARISTCMAKPTNPTHTIVYNA